jgi:hypothetical protein
MGGEGSSGLTKGPVGSIRNSPSTLTALHCSPLMDRLYGLNDRAKRVGISAKGHNEGGRVKVSELII